MKTKLISLGFVLGAQLVGADVSKILLRGTSVSVEDGRASGSASAAVGDLKVGADVIMYDRQTNVLNCDGVVTIRVSGGVMTTKDCVIELAPGEKRVAFLVEGRDQMFPKWEPLPTSLVPSNK